jgi:aryl-alcohol dehydrogenase-like predicted oxidoreductase
MKTDMLDAVQFHSSPSQSVLEKDGAVEALQDLQAQGKVRFIGMSGVLPELEEHVSMGVFDVLQIPYSALERRHEDWITKAADNGIGNVIRGGVAKGEPGYSGVSREEAWALFERAGLDELRDDGESRTSFMLRFTLSHPGMHTTIVGTLNPDHLAENVKAAQAGPLDQSTYEEAKKRLATSGEKPVPA